MKRSATNYLQIAIATLTISVVAETSLLSGLFNMPSFFYHVMHCLFMGVLIGSQLLLFLNLKKSGGNGKFALWYGIALTFTVIGDFVNGELSSVSLLSDKLTYALFLFGTGYIIYIVILYRYLKGLSSDTTNTLATMNLLQKGIPVLIVNVTAFYFFVHKQLINFPVLHHGAFIFNATIYVALPTLGLLFYLKSNKSTYGLIVYLGSFLIPFSDLVLFGTWFNNGENPISISLNHYSTNWILYFGGQVLLSMLPSFIALDEKNNG